MATLSYASVIERDQRYRMLADLGLRMSDIDAVKLMPRLTELVAPEHLELLAESRSILGEDGYWLRATKPAANSSKGPTSSTGTKAHPGQYARLCAVLGSVRWKLSKGLVIKSITAKFAVTVVIHTGIQTVGRITASL